MAALGVVAGRQHRQLCSRAPSSCLRFHHSHHIASSTSRIHSASHTNTIKGLRAHTYPQDLPLSGPRQSSAQPASPRPLLPEIASARLRLGRPSCCMRQACEPECRSVPLCQTCVYVQKLYMRICLVGEDWPTRQLICLPRAAAAHGDSTSLLSAYAQLCREGGRPSQS